MPAARRLTSARPSLEKVHDGTHVTTHIEQPACFDDATWEQIRRLNEAAVAAAPPLAPWQRQVIRDAFHTPVVATANVIRDGAARSGDDAA